MKVLTSDHTGKQISTWGATLTKTHLRVVTVLLDKQEIGPLIIDKISLDVFRTLHHMFQVKTMEAATNCNLFT